MGSLEVFGQPGLLMWLLVVGVSVGYGVVGKPGAGRCGVTGLLLADVG